MPHSYMHICTRTVCLERSAKKTHTHTHAVGFSHWLSLHSIHYISIYSLNFSTFPCTILHLYSAYVHRFCEAQLAPLVKPFWTKALPTKLDRSTVLPYSSQLYILILVHAKDCMCTTCSYSFNCISTICTYRIYKKNHLRFSYFDPLFQIKFHRFSDEKI